jgi:hypothetical protein
MGRMLTISLGHGADRMPAAAQGKKGSFALLEHTFV